MPQSLCKIYVHLIFHIKTTSPLLRESDLPRIHAYIAQLIKSTESTCVKVGGTGDHVHSLLMLSKDTALSYLVEEIKRNSSRWLKSIDAYYKCFAWQGGYAAFSVSQSVVNKTIDYIANQQEHHKKRLFEDEYRDFLQLYHIKYEEDYVFKD